MTRNGRTFPVPSEDPFWLDVNAVTAPASSGTEHRRQSQIQSTRSASGTTAWATPLKHGEFESKNGVLSRRGGAGSSHATEGPEDQKEP